MEKKLSVKNLTISFRTISGKVQAVRDISFDLMKGETLAIVGESGSGKSVTSKAILGILAGNAIIENGEIIYDGKDLLKIDEDDFHKIRGDKISMIFQDPLSSLNPIVKIGAQLTEAMLLKNKASRRNNKKDFDTKLSLLHEYIDIATEAKSNPELLKANKEAIENFKKFEYKHIELETEYNRAFSNASENIEEIEAALFEIEKKAFTDAKRKVTDIATLAKGSISRFVVHRDAERLTALVEQLLAKFKELGPKCQDYAPLADILKEIKAISEEATKYVKPNFFAMGYYVTFVDENLPDMSVEDLNKLMRQKLDEGYMLDFLKLAEKGIRYARERASKAREEAINVLSANMDLINKDNLDKKVILPVAKKMIDAVNNSIDRLALEKDSLAYVYQSAIMSAVDTLFKALVKNEKEKIRYETQMAKYQKLIEKGRPPEWKVVPADITDIDILIANIKKISQNIVDSYKARQQQVEKISYEEEAVALIDYLKEKASLSVYTLTQRMAKTIAIKLMEEVGIPEPRKRYYQYPFEFSGGMRQRIVIAIALSANPDILICDEPTTALDVTIQAQILELINQLKKERNLSVIFITHDLGVVANMADRVAVMYAGKIVEIGTSEDVFYNPAHPYTWALLSSMPDLDTNEKLEAIPGTPPNMIYPPVGDAFAARNKYALKIDFEAQPPMFKISDTHYAATWLLHPDAPKVDPPKLLVERIARMKKMGGQQ